MKLAVIFLGYRKILEQTLRPKTLKVLPLDSPQNLISCRSSWEETYPENLVKIEAWV